VHVLLRRAILVDDLAVMIPSKVRSWNSLLLLSFQNFQTSKQRCQMVAQKILRRLRVNWISLFFIFSFTLFKTIRL
jgi:hypothetical protein